MTILCLLCVFFKKPSDSLGVKSFEEIMREKQQKHAAPINASNKKPEKSAVGENERLAAAVRKTSVADAQSAPKTKQASPPRKYKFTPVVFDLDWRGSGKAKSDSNPRQPSGRWESLEIRADAENSTVLGRRRVSVTESAIDSAVAVTDVSLTVQSPVQLKSDLRTEASPSVITESPAGNSEERKVTPIIKRQSSTPLSDGSKKRRTSVDSRYSHFQLSNLLYDLFIKVMLTRPAVDASGRQILHGRDCNATVT